MTDLVVDVESEEVSSAHIKAPFDEAKMELENEGFRVISLEENALLRIFESRTSDVFKYGNWTREGFLCIPEVGMFLIKHSSILDYSKSATKIHTKVKEFYFTKAQVEKALEDSVLIPYKTKAISTDSFGDEEITTFAFGDQAKAYGEFLKEYGIENMPIWLDIERKYINEQKKPFLRQMWFSGSAYSSELCGDWGLNSFSRLRGVRNEIE